MAVFDNDPEKTAVLYVAAIMPMSRCTDLIERLRIKMGIITVPAESAQAVADILVGQE